MTTIGNQHMRVGTCHNQNIGHCAIVLLKSQKHSEIIFIFFRLAASQIYSKYLGPLPFVL
jgi:hypothetical protein